MKRKLLILTAVLVVNALFVGVALLPEFITFAQVAPAGVEPNDLIGAANHGRSQVLSVLRSQHLELFALAAANIVIVLWALKRVEP